MYNYIGGKIKVLARVIGWILLISGIIGFLCLASEDHIIIGLIPLVSGVVGFLSSWFLYALGQIVDDVSDLTYYVKDLSKNASDSAFYLKELGKKVE